jgi:Uma2 family endonuclease
VERDYYEKFAEYEASGIPEYWLIDPDTQRVRLYRLRAGTYRRVRPKWSALYSTVIAGFYLRPQWLWQEPLPDTIELLRELGVL